MNNDIRILLEFMRRKWWIDALLWFYSILWAILFLGVGDKIFQAMAAYFILFSAMQMKETSGFDWLPMARQRFATLVWIHRAARPALIGTTAALLVFLICAPLSLTGITGPMHLSWMLLLLPAAGFGAGGSAFLSLAARNRLQVIPVHHTTLRFLWGIVSVLSASTIYLYFFAIVFRTIPYAPMIASCSFWLLMAFGALSFLHREAGANADRARKLPLFKMMIPRFLTTPASLPDHLGVFVVILALFASFLFASHAIGGKRGIGMSLFSLTIMAGVLALIRYTAYRNSLRARRSMPVPVFSVWLDGVLPTFSAYLAVSIVESFAVARFQFPSQILYGLPAACGFVLLLQGLMSWTRDVILFRSLMGMGMFMLFLMCGPFGTFFLSSTSAFSVFTVMGIVMGISGLVLQYQALNRSSDFYVVIPAGDKA